MAQQQFKLRMPEPLREKLEESTRRSGSSLNTEIVRRLERSFQEETVFGGPRLTRYAHLMASVFAHAGQRTSGAADDSWLDNDGAYIVVVTSVMDALLVDRPAEVSNYVLQALAGRVATREIMKKEAADV